MNLFLVICLSSAMALLSAVPGTAQEKRAKTAGEATARTFVWGHGLSYVRDHFMKAAEKFPEDKYSYRPSEEARSFAEIVMHVARYNHLNAAADLGRPEEDVRRICISHQSASARQTKEIV